MQRWIRQNTPERTHLTIFLGAVTNGEIILIKKVNWRVIDFYGWYGLIKQNSINFRFFYRAQSLFNIKNWVID